MQLYEAFGNVLLAGVAWWVFRRRSFKGQVWWTYAAGYALLRFGLDGRMLRVEFFECVNQASGVLFTNPDQSIEIEGRHRRAVNHRRNAANDDVFNVVLAEDS